MTKPCAELKTAKRAWKRTERRSVMARTADIQVSASRGNTTQELQSEAMAFLAEAELSRGLGTAPHAEQGRSRLAQGHRSAPALCFLDLSEMPSRAMSLLKTMIPMSIFTRTMTAAGPTKA